MLPVFTLIPVIMVQQKLKKGSLEDRIGCFCCSLSFLSVYADGSQTMQSDQSQFSKPEKAPKWTFWGGSGKEVLQSWSGHKAWLLVLAGKKTPEHFALSEKNGLVARQVGHLFRGNIFCCCHHFYTSGLFKIYAVVPEQNKMHRKAVLTFSVVAFLISSWYHKNNLVYIPLEFVLWIGWKHTQKTELKISTGSFQVFPNSATWSCFINMHANGNSVVFCTAPFIYTSFMPVLSCAGLDLILKFNSR